MPRIITIFCVQRPRVAALLGIWPRRPRIRIPLWHAIEDAAMAWHGDRVADRTAIMCIAIGWLGSYTHKRTVSKGSRPRTTIFFLLAGWRTDNTQQKHTTHTHREYLDEWVSSMMYVVCVCMTTSPVMHEAFAYNMHDRHMFVWAVCFALCCALLCMPDWLSVCCARVFIPPWWPVLPRLLPLLLLLLLLLLLYYCWWPFVCWWINKWAKHSFGQRCTETDRYTHEHEHVYTRIYMYIIIIYISEHRAYVYSIHV